MKASVKKELLAIAVSVARHKATTERLREEEEYYACDLEDEDKQEASEALQEALGELADLLDAVDAAIADML